MKKLTIKTTLCLIACLFISLSSLAQQFKWVTGGGSIDDIGPGTVMGGSYVESTYYMCTDPNGNIYALNIVGNDNIRADTFYHSAYGTPNNILITSYNCSGQMRWAKLIASSSDAELAYGLVADSLGHIYMAGYIPDGALYIGNDTVITPFTYQSQGLIQLDTNGRFKWLRYVGDNSTSTLSGVWGKGSALSIDGDNNVHFLNYMKYGVHILPGDTSHYGVYDLKYNPIGTFLSATRLDLDSQWLLHAAVIDPVTNKLYVCGEINQGIYGGSLTDTFFAAAFDVSRNLLWMYFAGHGDDDGLTGITLDQNKKLHFSGAAQPLTLLIPTTFSFNGDSVSNTHYPEYDMSVILTTDTNGHPLWIKKFDGNLSVNTLNGIAQLPNGAVAAAGTFAGTVTDGVSSITTSTSQEPYLLIVDSAGNLQTIQQISGDGFYNGAWSISSDKIGNVFVGGQVVDSIWAGTPPIPAYYSNGGNTDFFVIKYGYDCNCTGLPTAAYTDTGTHTIGVTYTGTNLDLDSVVWIYGDGHSDTGISSLHTYSSSGTYTLCVAVSTGCGVDTFCRNVVVTVPTTEVAGFNGLEKISIYPNPAKDELNITGISKNTNYSLISITGITKQQGILDQGNNMISVKNFAPGIYILELTGESGARSYVRVVKE